MKIDILGTEYELTEDEVLKDFIAFCAFPTKEIKICKSLIDSTCLGEKSQSIKQKNKEQFLSEVKRHEIIHAFVGESGLGEQEEAFTRWVAKMYPKMKAVFEQLGIEG